MEHKKSILYFTEPGEDNTDATLRIAKERAEELGIRDIVVATTRGNTGVKAVELFTDYNVVVIPHVTGLKGPGIQELDEGLVQKIKAGGGKIQIAAHAFGGVAHAVHNKFDTAYPTRIIAQTLRIFGQGMKVCAEIAAMATDAGLIPVDQDVIAISGSNRGADTAVVIQPANSHAFFDMVVKEIITKPLKL